MSKSPPWSWGKTKILRKFLGLNFLFHFLNRLQTTINYRIAKIFKTYNFWRKRKLFQMVYYFRGRTQINFCDEKEHFVLISNLPPPHPPSTLSDRPVSRRVGGTPHKQEQNWNYNGFYVMFWDHRANALFWIYSYILYYTVHIQYTVENTAT